MEGMGEINLWSGGNVSEGGNFTYTKAKFREGGYLVAGAEQEFSCLIGMFRYYFLIMRKVAIHALSFLCLNFQQWMESMG